jgi:hypothetical protein
LDGLAAGALLSKQSNRFIVNVDMASRTRVFESSTGLVERVEWTPAHRLLVAEDFSPDFQIAFPYRGMFVWHVGGDAVVSDPNRCCSSSAANRFA